MKKFDESYHLLYDIYKDNYFPNFLVDKIKILIENIIDFLETGERFDIDLDVEDAIGERDW